MGKGILIPVFACFDNFRNFTEIDKYRGPSKIDVISMGTIQLRVQIVTHTYFSPYSISFIVLYEFKRLRFLS